MGTNRARVFVFVVAGLVFGAAPETPVPYAVRENAYRSNNVGVAFLEQYQYDKAAEAFRRALEIDPTLAIARLNLAVALYNSPELPGALREAKAAEALLPKAPQAPYIMGLIAKSDGRSEDAAGFFKRVLELDPSDVGANVNLGQVYLQQKEYPLAVAAFRSAVAAEPYNATAVYNLGIALNRAGQAEEGQRTMERFQSLRAGGYATRLGTSYPEQGRYAEALASTGAEEDRVDRATPPAKFVDATDRVMPPGAPAGKGVAPSLGRSVTPGGWSDALRAELVGGLGSRVTLFDFDGDGALDLFEVGPSGQHLYRNLAGRFVEVTREMGLDPATPGIGAVAGDYDNDGRADLFVLRSGGGTLYHNDGPRGFSDVTAAAGIPADPNLSIAAAFVDADHDGDLDLFIAGFVDFSQASQAERPLVFPDDFPGAPNRLLRNNGNGTFTDVTAKAGLLGSLGHAVAIVPTDFDNRRDVDLLVVNYDHPPNLFRNLRDGSFRDVAAEAGLKVEGRVTSVAAADVNKDGFTDFFFGRAGEAGILALSDGKEHFVLRPAPEASRGAGAAAFLDYDSDGLLDLLVVGAEGGRLFRNLGNTWSDVSKTALPEIAPGAARGASLAAGDVDDDGREDVVVGMASGGARVWRNLGDPRNHSLRVRLTSRVSNRSAVEAKVEMRAGSLRQKLETYAATPAAGPADVLFGLGPRAGVDSIRVLWPSGIVQAEAGPPEDKAPRLARSLAVTELDRKPSSCPYLYAWDGRRFGFITDFMGGGEMGDWVSPGEWNHPVPEEYVRIRDDQLVARGGRYLVRVTNELEETLYLDRVRLLAVAHPADVLVFPNEGLVGEPRPFKLYTSRGARPPVRAVDDHGHDVLAKIARMDRQYPDDFGRLAIRGYAEEHSLTLDLGLSPEAPALLLLTGWTNYAFSSDNVAASQSGLEARPPSLQVEDEAGRWATVIQNIGIPVGRPQTLVVDLRGRWLSPSRRVRIVTNMQVYWDQILVDSSGSGAPLEVEALEPLTAELRERGFSAEVSPDGREPFGYDYDLVSATSPWKVMTGRYTRPGDVRELLVRSDDNFVISRPGDEIALSFDAGSLKPLPRGWRRTFLFYGDGFSKEMDINSGSPDAVLPLPFHGMSRYPYQPPEAYPMTEGRRRLQETYDTRLVGSPIPPIELSRKEPPRISRAPGRPAAEREVP